MEEKPYIGAYVEKDLLERVENYRSSQRPIPSISDVIRESLIFFLNHHEKGAKEK